MADSDRMKFNLICRFATKETNIIEQSEVKFLIETVGLHLNSFRSGQCSLNRIQGNFHVILSFCFCLQSSIILVLFLLFVC